MTSFNKALEKLNKKLIENNLNVEIICVGGFVLDYHNIRSTYDIDGFFDSTNKLEALIKEVGDELNINKEDELWLNNSVSNLNKKPDKDICTKNNDYSNIELYIPPLEYILGMKIESMRDQDINDIGKIIKELNIKNPKKLEKDLTNYGFKNVDISIILEGFAEAYGIEWLEKYYKKNQKDINKRSRR